jgi:hypothetical protein
MSSDLSRAPSGAAGLRPLSVGELFDRAFSLYFRNVLTFAALLFAVMVPLAFVNYFMTRDLLDAYVSLIDAAVKHSPTPPDLSKLDTATASMLPWTGLYYFLFFFALPLANAAVVSGVSRAYLGLPVRFRECYADAFHRWGYVLILTLLWVIVAGVVGGAAFFVILFVGVVIGMLVTTLTVLKTFGVIVASAIGVVCALALVGLIAVAYLAFAASFIACVLEKVDPIRAFTLGFSRVFGGGLFWRSLRVAGGILLVWIVFLVIIYAFGGLAFWLTKAPFSFIAIAQLANVFFIAFAFVLVALYYYDIRIRREGFDLQVLADQLAASSAERAAPRAEAPRSP